MIYTNLQMLEMFHLGRSFCMFQPILTAAVAFASHAGDLVSICGRDTPKSLKQVVTAPLPNARQ